MFNAPKSLQIIVAAMAFAIAGCADQPSAPAAKVAAASPPVTAAEMVGAWYQVFFDTDNSDINPRGQMIVTTVADVATKINTTRVTVIGKTDSIGSKSANAALSHRRANSVRDALIVAGIPANRIDTRWTGELKQNVSTVDGVETEMNRVVDIIVVKKGGFATDEHEPE